MTNLTTKIGWNLENSYAELPDFFYSKINLSKVSSPKLVVLNMELAEHLGLDINELNRDEGISYLSGNSLPKGSIPIAQAYAGHQFGYFTMLGDGRAMLLGEQITPEEKKYDIQLKGSGITPYSRGGDGRAALGPMLREYIVSEAMHALNIPTTRSLAVVTTGEPVLRERILKGSILTRVASSHIRVGTFEYAANFGTKENIKQLADYTIDRHYKDIERGEASYLGFLKEVVKRQASLIAKWQLVGFIHGVMNTDNMALSGETIDYGPCAFMDAYNPDTVFSSIDTYGRYAYKNQPEIAVWNLSRFAETLVPLIHKNNEQAIELAQDAVTEFYELYHNNWGFGMRSKLGIFNEEADDEKLIEELLNLMHKNNEDYTNTFIKLTFGDTLMHEGFKEWHNKWQSRLQRQAQTKEESFELMKNSNPAVIPRNHRVEEALRAADEKGDLSVMERLISVINKPFAQTADQKEYAELPPPSFCEYKTFCGT
ncbi:MAG: YdiU family protein [Tissierellia bacterium]|nr:YdiU family protein [Tissierellia bacterium]MDD4436686.1 YdiU family protein [Tissierellia bacterium]